jgi:hypothetical protein
LPDIDLFLSLVPAILAGMQRERALALRSEKVRLVATVVTCLVGSFQLWVKA